MNIISMAETEAPSNPSSSSSNIYHHNRGFDDKVFLTELVLSAAQQLMQLSESSSSNSGSGSEKRRRSCNKGVKDEEEGVDDDVEYQSQLISVITCAKIQEIFGEEDVDEVQDFRPIKKKTTRYRLLADIYFTTKPISR